MYEGTNSSFFEEINAGFASNVVRKCSVNLSNKTSDNQIVQNRIMLYES